MGACAMQSFNNVTAEVWQCGINAAKQYGVNITSNKGQATKSGFTVAWNYDPNTEICQLQCTDSPWIVPCSVINSQIDHAVNGCYGQHGQQVQSMLETA